MEISYKRTAKQSFMILRGECEPWGYEERMIAENKIDVLLDFNKTLTDGNTEFWYDISGKRSLMDFFLQERVCVKTVKLFFLALQEALNRLDKYLIGTQSLILTEDTIFMSNDVSEHAIYLCACPVIHQDMGEQIRHIMEHLIKEVDSNSPEDVRIIYELFDISLRKDAQITDFIAVFNYPSNHIEELEEDDWADLEEESDDEIEYPFLSEMDIGEVKKDDKKKRGFNFFWRIKKRKKELFPSNDIVEDFIYDSIEEINGPISQSENNTTFLSLEDCMQKRLIYKGNKGLGDMYIEKDVFCIGSKEKGNDGVIDVPVISRYHAKIVKTNNEYMIEDLNSKNGTTVNGKMLEYRNPVFLKSGDRINFADVPYQFL